MIYHIKELVLEGGFEPPLTAPKAAVLPLDDPRVCLNYIFILKL